MSKLRSLIPVRDHTAEDDMVFKLEKALFLCEILENTTLNNFTGKNRTMAFLSHSPRNRVTHESIFDVENLNNHFKVPKNAPRH